MSRRGATPGASAGPERGAVQLDPAGDGARRVLMLAFEFAPGGGVAVQRTLGFARHLPDCGWEPTVLTVRAAGGAPFDDEIERCTGGRTTVLRTGYFGRRQAPSLRERHDRPAAGRLATRGRSRSETALIRRLMRTWLLVPDEAVGWLPFAVARGSSFIARHAPNAIYSTSGPPTAHLVALLLSARWRLPWVADFRDPWTAVPNEARRDIYSSRARLAVDRALERAVLARADAVITVSEEQRRIMRRLAPDGGVDTDGGRHGGGQDGRQDGQPGGRQDGQHYVIANGYEPSWLRGPSDADQTAKRDGITIGYTGSFYRAGEEPGPMFRALAGLYDSRVLRRGDIRVVIASPQHARVAREAAAHGLAHAVRAVPPVPHDESRALQRGSTVLWLALSSSHGEQGALTAKIYEYMAARRPVLAVVPPDSRAGDLVRQTGIGESVHPRDVAGLQQQILRIQAEYLANGAVAWRGSMSAIAPFARPRLTEALAAVLDDAEESASAKGRRT